MLTERDMMLLGWVARLGAVGSEHVMRRLGVGRSQAYARLGELTSNGLLERCTLLYRRPSLYTATREGLAFAGLQSLGVFRLSPAGFEHAYEVAGAAVALDGSAPGWLFGEREVRVIERERGELFASMRLGERGAVHRPDLALLTPDGAVIAVEIELSLKAPRRLSAICRGWARARHIEHVCYFAPPHVARAVDRAIARERARERISVRALGDFQLPTPTRKDHDADHHYSN